MITEAEFKERLFNAIEQEQISLPTLPEVALRVRDAVENDNSSASDVAEIITSDAAVTARLLQVVNSPLYGGRVAIESVQMAIARLGMPLVRDLVTSAVMKNMFQPTSDVLDQRLRDAWQNSVQVAAICRALAYTQPHLDTNQAMLAGLLHNIGVLPIYALAEADSDLIQDEALLDHMTDSLYPDVGMYILSNWNFPQPLIKAVEFHRTLDYNPDGRADYTDVVLVARLQTLPEGHPDTLVDWSTVSAFKKVGLEPEMEVISMEGAAEQIQEVENLLL
jgi:HD-like signal output (HDOD) protein